jgi:hypothetical protein
VGMKNGTKKEKQFDVITKWGFKRSC